MRWDESLPNRRVNSAWVLGDPGIPDEQAIAHVDGWYAERRRRPIFKTEPGTGTDTLLSGREIEAPTAVFTRPTARSDAPDVAFLDRDQLGEWCAAFASVRGFDHDRASALETAYRSLPDLGLAVVFAAGAPVAVGLGVLDAPWIGLFDIATSPAARRQGLGSLVTTAVVSWGNDRGASNAYLQVEEGNNAALALYERLGFTRAYGYHYRVGTGAVKPTD